MDYQQALRALDERIPTRMVPDLDRMRALSDLLDHPQRTYPSIHITGTNGKTTTAFVATELLRAAGLAVGTYTSPHLHHVRERIAYDGTPMSEDEFAETFSYLEPYLAHVDARGQRVTYFETLTMMAEVWFAERAVDVAVMEVGMGGEWDATNLVDGRVAVFSEVSVDHPELGSTPQEVAREKVGIIKDGALVVSAGQTPSVLAVIEERGRERGAEVKLAGRDFEVVERGLAVGGQALDLRIGDRRYDEVFIPLHGRRLGDDALLGLAAVSAFLGDRELEDDLLRAGFASVRSPGRVEVVRRHPTIVVDGAHNPSAANALRAALEQSFRWNRLILVLGILADKDLAGVVEVLAPIADVAIATQSDSPRAAPYEQVAKALEGVAKETTTAATVAGAVARALELGQDGDLVVVTGSFTTIAEARKALGAR